MRQLRPEGYTENEWRSERRRRQRARERGLIVARPPSSDLTGDELVQRREEDFQRRLAYEEGRKLIEARVLDHGPVGIVHLGDPHLDDDGTDWPRLRHDIALIQHAEGLYAATVGDATNNWVGRLAHLYGQQSTTAREAWILAEWMFNQLKGRWLYVIGGNHDAWSGDGDPLQWITGSVDALYESSEARIRVAFPSGLAITVNARHDFKGDSQWNPTHGPMKAAQLGIRDDILICGHKHKSGYSPIKDPESGKICHCIQVASYKRYDRYAREKGFRDQSLSPCVVTVIDPDATDPADLIQVFWTIEAALTYMRGLREMRGVA